jgi:hypothetical protein
MSDNGGSSRWHWILTVIVILALIAIIVAVTLSQPSNPGSKSNLVRPERDRFLAAVQARADACKPQLLDMRGRPAMLT